MAINIDDAIAMLDKIDARSLDHNAGALLRVIEGAKRLVASLESPFMNKFCTAVVPMQVTASLRVISDIGLWDAWRGGGGKEATLIELSDMCTTPCDVELLRKSDSR